MAEPAEVTRTVLERYQRLLAQADPGTPQGLRDRALLETFYATAMRRMEIANLKLYDIDADRGTRTA